MSSVESSCCLLIVLTLNRWNKHCPTEVSVITSLYKKLSNAHKTPCSRRQNYVKESAEST